MLRSYTYKNTWCALCLRTNHNPVLRGLSVDPEGHPWQDHQQTTGYVDVDQEIAHVSSQDEVGKQHGELSWERKYQFVTSLQTNI